MGKKGDFEGVLLSDTQKNALLTAFQDSTLLQQFIHFPSSAPVSLFDWYATYAFPLPTNQMAYVIRAETDYIHSNGIYALIYDASSGIFTAYYELANRYSIGGNDGFKRSWLLDVNGDLYKEVLTAYDKQQRYYEDSDDINSDERWFVVDDSLWVALYQAKPLAWTHVATYQNFTKGIFAEHDTGKEHQVDSFLRTSYATTLGINKAADLLAIKDSLEASVQQQ